MIAKASWPLSFHLPTVFLGKVTDFTTCGLIVIGSLTWPNRPLIPVISFSLKIWFLGQGCYQAPVIKVVIIVQVGILRLWSYLCPCEPSFASDWNLFFQRSFVMLQGPRKIWNHRILEQKEKSGNINMTTVIEFKMSATKSEFLSFYRTWNHLNKYASSWYLIVVNPGIEYSFFKLTFIGAL